MSEDVKVYDLLISCPSDVAQFVDLIELGINRFNNYYGRFNKVIVRTRHWSKDAYSKMGGRPQEELNKQIVDSSDMIIGIFWTRFGTKTENYGCGTEEEIERMISMKRQVFLYFLNKPINLENLDFNQYKNVRSFKEKYKSEGIYFDVEDEKQLVDKIRENLELYFDSIIRGDELKKRNVKNEILWVDDRPENNVYERRMMERFGLEFTLALSTEQALRCMKNNSYSLIISDMGRKEGAREGYVLLDEIRKINKKIPYIIYAGSKKAEHVNEVLQKGGQGCTNEPGELVDLVIENLLKS